MTSINHDVYLVLCLVALTVSGCTQSIRHPEMGPKMTPVGLPSVAGSLNAFNATTTATLPTLTTTPIHPNDTTVAPVFQPERLMVWHIQGYTKSNAVFIGPHTVVLKVEPGRFLRELKGTSSIPTAAPFIETAPQRAAQGVSQTPTPVIPQPLPSQPIPTLKPQPPVPTLKNLPQTVRDQVKALRDKARLLGASS